MVVLRMLELVESLQLTFHLLILRQPTDGYNSEELDEPEGTPKKKKRKVSKAVEAKLKAKAKAKAKRSKDNDDDDYDGEEDAYTALVKTSYKSTRPPVGSFEDCAKCEQEFTVVRHFLSLSPAQCSAHPQTKYTMAAVPPPGFLCHKCAKSSGIDPFKKPPAPRKRKAPADKRNVVHFEEMKTPSLATLCINVNSLLTSVTGPFSLLDRLSPSILTTSRPWEISEP